MKDIKVVKDHEGTYVVGHGMKIAVEDDNVEEAKQKLLICSQTVITNEVAEETFECFSCKAKIPKGRLKRKVECPGKPVVFVCSSHNASMTWVD